MTDDYPVGIELGSHAQAVQSVVECLAEDVDPAGVLLMRLVRVVANQYDALAEEHLASSGLSGPRWGVLLRLLAEEELSGAGGASPTHLSRCQSVSKNTISSHLRGLEDQGLVERALDSTDKRVFRISLTQAGRELIRRTAPEHIRFLNHLVGALEPADRAALIELLAKLHRSLLQAEPGLPEPSRPVADRLPHGLVAGPAR